MENASKEESQNDRTYFEASGLLATMLEGIVEGKNWKGRPRQSYEYQLMKDTGCKSFVEMKRLAQKRQEWRDATH
ncbi:hypothetical protein PGB90_003704 [Kerria lacca]